MSSLEDKVLKIGTITASGTGPEVINVLKTVINGVAKQYGIKVGYKEFEDKFGYKPKTFHELKDEPDKDGIERKEVQNIVEFLRECHKDGFKTIFQTATNAGTLYKVRMDTEQIKLMPVEIENGTILIAREQSQGFYAIDSKKETNDAIMIECSYSKDKLYRTLDAAIKEANEIFGNGEFSIRIVYKYHLFKEFNKWIKDYITKKGLQEKDIQVVQPDTGYDYLMRKFPRSQRKDKNDKKKNVLCVVSNEIGDIFTEVLPNHYGVGDKATMYAKNISLHKDTEGQLVYQTIHGSADDIAGQNKLNPFATIRAAADILENAGIDGIKDKFEKAINEATNKKYVTADMGGDKKTDDVVNFVLEYVKNSIVNC